MPNSIPSTIRIVAAVCLVMACAFASQAFAQPKQDLEKALFHDPANPTSGNPKGDVTVVTFFDYNCPYCRKSLPILNQVAKQDGNVRIVYKDWPILKASSISAAKLALAAKFQGKYLAAHTALMNLKGTLTDDRMRAALKAADIDLARLDRDAKTHAEEINNELYLINSEAEAIGIQSTPSFLVNHYLAATSLDEAQFKQIIAKARSDEAPPAKEAN